MAEGIGVIGISLECDDRGLRFERGDPPDPDLQGLRRQFRVHQLDDDFARLAVTRGAALNGSVREGDRQDFIAEISAEHFDGVVAG